MGSPEDCERCENQRFVRKLTRRVRLKECRDCNGTGCAKCYGTGKGIPETRLNGYVNKGLNFGLNFDAIGKCKRFPGNRLLAKVRFLGPRYHTVQRTDLEYEVRGQF